MDTPCTGNRIKSYFFLLVFGFLILAQAGCSKIFGSQYMSLERSCDNDNYAYLVSFDENKVYSFPQLAEMKHITADLMVEPRDPEIAALGETFDGYNKNGEPTLVAILENGRFDDLKELPKNVNWKKVLPEYYVSKGRAFLLKSSTGRYYKVKIDDLRHTYLKFSFQELKPS